MAIGSLYRSKQSKPTRSGVRGSGSAKAAFTVHEICDGCGKPITEFAHVECALEAARRREVRGDAYDKLPDKVFTPRTSYELEQHAKFQAEAAEREARMAEVREAHMKAKKEQKLGPYLLLQPSLRESGYMCAHSATQRNGANLVNA